MYISLARDYIIRDDDVIMRAHAAVVAAAITLLCTVTVMRRRVMRRADEREETVADIFSTIYRVSGYRPALQRHCAHTH